VTTIQGALPAIKQLGLALIGPTLETPYSMRAPLWGTLMLAVEALLLGFPVALALAVVMREFEIPVVSRVLGGAVGILAGIPPIVYAVCTLIAVQAFMAPKFAGAELNDNRVEAAILGVPVQGFGGLPDRIPNTSFLGGVMLALLIVPFMTPLIDDALRAVPVDLKRGSYALGASRWYTLRHIVLPGAVPGMVSAATLGAILAIGEVVIPYFVVGGSVNLPTIPNPAWDIFRPTPALTSWGAGQMGAIGGEGEGTLAISTSVSFVSGLALLLLAALIMGVEQIVLKRLRGGDT
jgi:phosphate transport system permease protein